MATLLKVSWEEDVRRIQVPELTFDQVQAASLRVFSDKLQAWEEDLRLEFREGSAAPPRLLTKESFPDLVVQHGRQQQARLQKPGTPPLAGQSPLRLQVVCRLDQVSQSPAPALLSVKAEPEDVQEPETPLLEKQALPQPPTPPEPWWDTRLQTILAPGMSAVKEEQEEAEGFADYQEAAQTAEEDEVADSSLRLRQSSVKVKAELAADERSLHRAARQLLREATKAEQDAKRSAERALRKAAKATRQAAKRARKTNRKAAKRVEKVARRMARHAKARKDACREKRDKKDKHVRKAKRELKAKRKATKEASQSEMYEEEEEEQEQTEASASMPSERRRRKRSSTRAFYEYGSWRSQAEEEERECDEELRLGSACEGSEEDTNARAHVQARKAKKQARKDLKLLKRRIKAQKKACKSRRRDEQEGVHNGEEQGHEPGEACTRSKCDQEDDGHEEAHAALLTRNESPAPLEEPEEELRRLVELGFRGLLAGSPAQASGSS